MNLILRNVLFVFLLFSASLSFSQERKYSTTSKKAIKYFEKAIYALDNHNEDDAEKLILKSIKKDPNFIEAYTVLGDMYSNKRKSEMAIENYKKALAIDPSFFPNTLNSLGEEQLKLSKYTEAKENFRLFLKTDIKNAPLKRKAQRNLRNAEFAEWAIAHPVEFKPENLGSAVNSRFQEYLPALTADGQTLIVTVLLPDDTTKETLNDRQKHEDFYASKLLNGAWTKRNNIGPPINSIGNEGAQCISPDGQFLFFTSCEEGMGEYSGGRTGFGSCDIFYSQKIGETWSKPQNMGQPINSKYWDTQPSVSSDGNDLYFVSKRNGGKGGSDIWKSSLTKE